MTIKRKSSDELGTAALARSQMPSNIAKSTELFAEIRPAATLPQGGTAAGSTQ
jgi:hypothetical protein